LADATRSVQAVERNSGRTALHKAAYWGHHELCRILLQEYGLDPNVQDFNGDTALHDAARFGHVKVVEHLLAGGIDVTKKNKAGQDAAAVASSSECARSVLRRRWPGNEQPGRAVVGAKFGIERKWYETIIALLNGKRAARL
jgi:ankyrin repeat protein